MSRLIDVYAKDFREAGFTYEQVNLIVRKMLDYALCACMDSEVRKEILNSSAVIPEYITAKRSG